jgi:aromatic-L-amino-acid decarboxylase
MGALNFADLSAEQSREARGLRIWLTLKMLGADAFRRALDEKLDLARFASGELAQQPAIELIAEPQLSILAFRVRAPGLDGPELDQLNQRVLETVNRPGPIHLSATTLGGRFAIRICVLPFRTHRPTVEICIERIRSAVREVLADDKGNQ